MSVTQETIQRVLRSWMAIEVLTPQITKDGGWSKVAAERSGRLRNRKTDAQDGPSLWRPPQDHDLPPWPLLPDPPPRHTEEAAPAREAETAQTLGADDTLKKDRVWYSVILGALPARDAFARLDAVFQDESDEDQVERKMSGHIIAASVWLDESGVMVPDTLAVASFAWGIGHVLSGGAPAGLPAWHEQEQDIKARISDLLTPLAKDGQHRSLTWNDLRGVSLDLALEIGVPEELWIPTPCVIETIRRDPPEGDILSSFYLSDLAQVLENVATLPVAVSSYLGLNPPADTHLPVGQGRDCLVPASMFRLRLARTIRNAGTCPSPRTKPLVMPTIPLRRLHRGLGSIPVHPDYDAAPRAPTGGASFLQLFVAGTGMVIV